MSCKTQIGWNRVNEILAPLLGENFLFNPLRRKSGTSPKSIGFDGGREYKKGVKMALQTERYEDTQLYKIRHSAAHVMAQAVMEMFPDGKVTIGPPVENGFYYDFDLPRNLTPEDLELLEKRMRQIVQGKHQFTKRVVSAEEARQIFADQPYKLELIEGLEKGGLDEYGNPLKEKPDISIYQQDTFMDLCRGPHVESTKEIKQDAFKLMTIAGAYWRGDEKNKMLQRI